MKRIFYGISVFVFIICLFSVSSFAGAFSKVDDAADLLSFSEEEIINDSLVNFIQSTDFSAVVLTSDNSEGKTSQQYADDYFDNLIIFDGWEENGILFLIDMDNREVCISTMGECISLYSASIDYIIDCGFDELVNGNYFGCFDLMISASLDCYQDDYNGDFYIDDYYGEHPIDDEYYDGDLIQQENSFDLSNVLICILISAIIGAVSVFAVKSSYKNMGKGDEFDADDLLLNLTDSDDTVISRNVITTRVPRNNNHNSHGGPSGGVSHRSSGGFSHGGGSRKF